MCSCFIEQDTSCPTALGLRLLCFLLPGASVLLTAREQLSWSQPVLAPHQTHCSKQRYPSSLRSKAIGIFVFRLVLVLGLILIEDNSENKLPAGCVQRLGAEPQNTVCCCCVLFSSVVMNSVQRQRKWDYGYAKTRIHPGDEEKLNYYMLQLFKQLLFYICWNQIL